MAKPSPDEIEITLLGPGVGESVVAHVGNDEWIVVDSCVARGTNEAAALAYLRGLGVEASAIKVIVATHWHDDHIRGLAQILRAAPDATFVCSGALKAQEFDALVGSVDPIEPSSGVSEMLGIHDLLNERQQDRPARYRAPILASEGTVIFRSSSFHMPTTVTALAPSPGEIWAAKAEMRQLANAANPSTRALVENRNFASVVLLVEALGCAALLGGDLEERGTAGIGWLGVVASSVRPLIRAQYFKVPHHGSRNAHFDGVWSNLLDRDVIATVTPFRKGRVPLPRDSDTGRLCDLTNRRLYATASKSSAANPRRDSTIERLMSTAVRERKVLIGAAGRVTTRWRRGVAPTVALKEGAHLPCG